jgi:phage gpG-like protein
MIVFNARLDNTSLELRIQSMGILMRGRIRDAVEQAAIMLTRYVKEEKLSGQVLKNRTGTLRRKINYKLSETPSTIEATVGVKLAYAAAHEYGFDGMVHASVRAHVRNVNSRNVRSQVEGKNRKVVQGITYVREHERNTHMHLPERSFLRSSLAENQTKIRDMLEEAARGAGARD